MFDIELLKASFDKSIKTLEKSEAVVRETLRELSRDVLYALHEHENIVYINRLIKAKVTPVNRKALVLFFQNFTGFHYSEEQQEFTKKDKTTYDERKAQALEFLEDPLNNFWVWADREIKMEAKAFDPDKVTKYISHAFKKAEKDGYTKADVIRALFKDNTFATELPTILEAMVIPAHAEEEADAA